MTNANIRHARRDTVHHSVMNFLEALRLKRDVSALALTTDDGVLIAGVGELDLERMAEVGGSTATQAEFWNTTLYTHRFELNDRVLRLVAAGAPIRDDAAVGGLCRILAA